MTEYEYDVTTALPPDAIPADDVTPVLRTFRLAVNVYILGPLCLLGILGNLATVLVLGWDQSIRKTTRFLLQMLAVADGFYLVTCLSFQTLKALAEHTTSLPAPLQRAWPVIELLTWPSASIAQTCTAWLVVVVSADRYVAICRPLHAPRYSTMRRARVAVCVVWAVAVFYNVPRFFERQLLFANMENNSTRDMMVTETSLRTDHTYNIIYKTCLFLVVRFIAPFAALAFFNACLIRAIRQSSVRADKNVNQAANVEQARRVNRMLVVVVIVFVVCALPDLMLRLVLSIGYTVTQRRVLLHVNVVSEAFLTLNSCANFVIYCLMGSKFRRILVRMLLRRGMTGGGVPLSVRLAAGRGSTGPTRLELSEALRDA